MQQNATTAFFEIHLRGLDASRDKCSDVVQGKMQQIDNSWQFAKANCHSAAACFARPLAYVGLAG
jgi:predicted lipid-binding transport protein (Tim44 family)